MSIQHAAAARELVCAAWHEVAHTNPAIAATYAVSASLFAVSVRVEAAVRIDVPNHFSDYITPYASIASATFTNPPMFAPFT